MKKLLATLVAVCSLSAQAQPAAAFIPGVVSVTRFIMDLREQDKLEDTPPVVVQSSGTSDTCDQALTNAKRYALEKVNGTWVSSIQRADNGKYDEEIVQYSGGVIKSYKYIRNDCTFVIIEAEVMKRSNRVQMEAADIRRDQIVHVQGIKDSLDRKREAVSKIDSRTRAVYFKPSSTEMNVEGGSVVVRITGTFAYRDKWRADYLELREQFGYFNLESFIPNARIVITGLDSARMPVFKTQLDGGEDWKLWGRRSYGASPTMEVYTNKTEEATVKFLIPMDKLETVRSFIVEVI